MASSTGWRVRDAADDLLRQRHVVAPESMIGDDVALPMSTHFDIETAKSRLQRDKAAIVRYAFDAAATFVVENCVADSTDSSGDDTVMMQIDDNPKNNPSLKKVREVVDTANLEAMRIFSMERAVDNKDLGKRKLVFAREQKLRQQQEPTPPAPVPEKAKSNTVTSKSPNNDKGTLPAPSKVYSAKPDVPKSNSSSGAPVSASSVAPKTSDVVKKEETPSGPKVSRNTSASSSTAVEARARMSRAILCTTANVVFDALTPSFPEHPIDVANLPESLADAVKSNTANSKADNDNKGEDKSESSPAKIATKVYTMAAVVAEAQALGHRIQSAANASVERSRRRFQFRKDTAYYEQKDKENRRSIAGLNVSEHFRPLKNPFSWSQDGSEKAKKDLMDVEGIPSSTEIDISSITKAWKELCVPRLMSVLQTGAGHAIVHDVLFSTRHARISHFMQEYALKTGSFGPHLIITTQPDVNRWAKQFKARDSHLRLLSMVGKDSLRAMPYHGDKDQRRRLRKRFPDATGLPEASFHVIITSYTDFLNDYIHFCQFPFEIVLMDDGCSWMAAAGEPNSSVTNATLTKVWEEALFSKNDHNVGLAGSFLQDWDFERDDFGEDVLKDSLIGLTARHRIMTSAKAALSAAEILPFSRLVNFLTPQFADAVREEWDRSRIGHDRACREHFQKLLTRSIVVHHPNASVQDLYTLALWALRGKIRDSVHAKDPDVPSPITDDQFVADLKGSNARRYQLRWLGPPESSWLRYELGVARFDPILDAMLVSTYCGHVCEEIITVLATSNAGSTGQVTGSLAYKFAVRCGRSFGSEQGLRQHHSTMHASPGTWLCRICGADCVTSLARTHHERTCGQPKFKQSEDGPPPAAGKTTKKKEQHGSSSNSIKKGAEKTNTGQEEKDSDGSARVPSYRGVWMDPNGKYFVKVQGERLTEASSVILFDTPDEAARKYDAEMKKSGSEAKVELNFKSDGTRNIYEGSSTSSTTGFGGNLDNVVPALSVINIRDLPKEVKPLLRDPRQTSRTGGNSKRHVYAYRGVCRQARKGHDRWQSQISFCGRNFYLGTYESEWDAAAIYAWAHLILYGKEATDQAQKEGEEAAAAYEKEKEDIAAGIIPAPAPKLSKKEKQEEMKRKSEEKKRAKENEKKAKELERKKAKEEQKKKQKAAEIKKEPKKRPAKQENPKKPVAKKQKPTPDEGHLNQVLGQIAAKTPNLVPHPQFAEMNDEELAREAVKRLVAARGLDYCISDIPLRAPIDVNLRPCAQKSSNQEPSAGIALLLGLNPSSFYWNFEDLIKQHDSIVSSTLEKEYGPNGLNASFTSFLQGTLSVIGCANSHSRQVYSKLGLGSADKTLGGPIGCIDCNIGGSSGSCSESAACIQYRPTVTGQFIFSALSTTDLVTLNGRRITPELGTFPLFHEDICTVGARVFVFLLPADSV